MINEISYTKEHIESIQKQSKNDPIIIERAIFAFGLLEALSRVGLDFIFKGGTCLMLLLDSPKRLSTDIDIVVDFDTKIDEIIEKASVIFPFVRQEEDVRKGKNNIVKRHFKFTYNSPTKGNEFVILLDVLFEQNNYAKIIKKGINNDLIVVDEPEILVTVPTAECILGDKLTAFAPHSTGILLGTGKNLEIIKQLFDCARLFPYIESFSLVKDSYKKIVEAEIAYRGLNITFRDTLQDTIDSAMCLISRGKTNSSDYAHYLNGVDGLKAHIFSNRYSGEKVILDASIVFYFG